MATKNYRGIKFSPSNYRDLAKDTENENNYSRFTAKNYDQAQDNLARYNEEYNYQYGLTREAPRSRVDTTNSTFGDPLRYLNVNKPKTTNNLLPSIEPIQSQQSNLSGLDKYREDMNKKRGNVPKLVNTILNATLDPLSYAAYENPLSQRVLVTAGESIAGKGSMKNTDGTSMDKKDAGALGNFVTDAAGTILGMKSLPIGNSNLLNLTDKAGLKASELVAKNLPQNLNNAASKILPSMVRGAVDSGIGDLGLSLSQGEDLGTSLKTGAKSALGGALLFGAGKGIGEGLNNIKGLNKATNTKAIQTLDNAPKTTSQAYMEASQGIKNNIEAPIIKESNMSSIRQPKITTELPNFNKINNEVAVGGEVTGPLKNVSQFKTNTMRKAPMLDTLETQKVIDDIEATYNVKSNAQSLKRAMAELETDPNTVINRIRESKTLNGAEDTVASGLITKQLRQQAESTGDYSELKSWLEEVQPKVTETAQSLQALSTWKKLTPDGALMKAQQVVGQVQRGLKETNPKLLDNANKLADDVKNTIDNIDKGAAEEVVKDLTPESILAGKVQNQIKPNNPKQLDVENQMINTLFNIAKKSLPKKEVAKTDPMTLVTLALNNRNKYQNVWNGAKEILSQRFANDPEKLSLLDDYLNQRLRPVFYENNLNKAISTKLKEMNVNLSDVVRQHYSVNSKVRKDLTQSLVEKAGLTGEEAEYLSKYINNRMKELTKTKKEQILSQMFKDRPTPQQKTLIQKTLEFSNLGGFQNTNYKDLAYERFGIPTLSNDDIGFINDTMKKIETMADGREKDIEFAKVKQLIADKIPPTLSDKVKTIRNISLLLNPKTFTRNIVGNALMGAGDTAANTVSATLLRPLDNFMSKITGVKTTALPSFKAQGKGFKEGIQETLVDSVGGLKRADLQGKTPKQQAAIIIDAISNPIKTNSNAANKFELGQSLTFKNKPMRILENALSTSLAIGDKPFSNAYYNDVINQLKKANKTETVTDAMKEIAEKVAAERTYQDTNTITTLAQAIKRMPTTIQNHPRLQEAIQIFVDSVFPYTKTPASILKRGLEYSPEGIIEGVLKLGFAAKDGTLTPQLQREILDRISRGLVGTGVIAGGVSLANQGLLTGAADKDRDVANFETQMGKQPFAVKIGDKNYSYSQYQPISMPLGVGAEIANSLKGDSNLGNAAISGLSNALEFYSDQPMVQSIQRLAGSANSSKGIGERVLDASLELPKQFVPTVGKQIAQISDPINRNTYSPDYLEYNLLNPIKSKLPGASKTLEPKIDTLGNEVKNFQGDNSLFNIFLNPGYTTTEKSTPVQKLIMDTYNQTGDKTIFPRVADRSITYKNNKYDLTAEELTKFQSFIGTKTNNEIKANITTLNKLTPEKRAKELQKIITRVYDDGKKSILRQRGVKVE